MSGKMTPALDSDESQFLGRMQQLEVEGQREIAEILKTAGKNGFLYDQSV